MEWLIDEGAAMDAVDRFGTTPLLDAIRRGRDACARLLHRRGAPLLVPADPARSTALLLSASAAGKVDLVDRLLEFGGVDVNATDSNGRTAAQVAATQPVLHVLRSHGARTEATAFAGPDATTAPEQQQQQPPDEYEAEAANEAEPAKENKIVIV